MWMYINMKTERTIDFYPAETPISIADHLLWLCKMMEASASDIAVEEAAASVA